MTAHVPWRLCVAAFRRAQRMQAVGAPGRACAGAGLRQAPRPQRLHALRPPPWLLAQMPLLHGERVRERLPLVCRQPGGPLTLGATLARRLWLLRRRCARTQVRVLCRHRRGELGSTLPLPRPDSFRSTLCLLCRAALGLLDVVNQVGPTGKERKKRRGKKKRRKEGVPEKTKSSQAFLPRSSFPSLILLPPSLRATGGHQHRELRARVGLCASEFVRGPSSAANRAQRPRRACCAGVEVGAAVCLKARLSARGSPASVRAARMANQNAATLRLMSDLREMQKDAPEVRAVRVQSLRLRATAAAQTIATRACRGHMCLPAA